MALSIPITQPEQQARQTYKWHIMIVVIFGLFMVMLDTTIVNIAIPHLQTTFGAGLSDITWVATGYTLAEGVGIPLAPTLAVLLGNKRFYMLILAFFTLGSALCGLAWSLTALIIFRILQGIAGASMIPMSMSLLFEEFPPEERGVAMGALGIPLLVAPALGPTIGGYIVTFINWRVMFYINVPIGIAGFFMASILMRESQPQGARSLDIPGFLFSSVGMASLLYAFSSAGDGGWGSSRVVTFLLIGLSSIVIFVTVELLTIQNGKQPLLDLRIFRIFSFAGGCIALSLTMFALYGAVYLSTLYLQVLRGLSAFDAGLILLPQALGSAVASGLGGRLVDKLGVKAVVIPGLLILGTVLWNMSHLTLSTPFAIFQILLIVRGLGQGLIGQPVIVASMANITPEQNTQASTLSSVVRSVSASFAVALISTTVTTRTTFHYVRLAEQVTPDSATGQLLQSSTLIVAAHIVSYLKQQAYMLAMNDVFTLSIGAVALTGLVVLLTAHNPPKKLQLLLETKSKEVWLPIASTWQAAIVQKRMKKRRTVHFFLSKETRQACRIHQH